MTPAGARLRFDRFMELALYDAKHGYYTARVRSVGRRGDFATSATLSPSLGRAVADRFRRSPESHLIEIGAGTGALSAALRGALPWLTRLRTRFHIVERSPRLRAIQRERLGARVCWHDTMTDALRATKGRAFIVSNELVDAFPVRIFRRTTDRWQELFLEPREDSLTESWQPATSLPESTIFAHAWPDGQRIEVHEAYRDWLATWLPAWSRGEFLTIDYGGSPPDIYHRRPAGTLRAFLHHELLTGPDCYRHPGHQDLTADVNFDDLLAWSRELKARSIVTLVSQRDFLGPHTGLGAGDQFLTDPDGAGTAFQVLTQKLREAGDLREK